MGEYIKKCKKCFSFRSRVTETNSIVEKPDGKSILVPVFTIENYCDCPFQRLIVNGIKVFPPTGQSIPDDEEDMICYFFQRRQFNRS